MDELLSRGRVFDIGVATVFRALTLPRRQPAGCATGPATNSTAVPNGPSGRLARAGSPALGRAARAPFAEQPVVSLGLWSVQGAAVGSRSSGNDGLLKIRNRLQPHYSFDTMLTGWQAAHMTYGIESHFTR